jgi:hypothetical protein
MSDYLTVGEAAKRLGCVPYHISEVLYRRRIGPEADFPVIGSRRLIPVHRLDDLAKVIGQRTGPRGGVAHSAGPWSRVRPRRAGAA